MAKILSNIKLVNVILLTTLCTLLLIFSGCSARLDGLDLKISGVQYEFLTFESLQPTKALPLPSPQPTPMIIFIPTPEPTPTQIGS